MGNAVTRVPPDPLDRPRITRSKSDGLARSPSDGLRDAPRASTDGLAFGIPSPAFPRTESRLSTTSTLIQPLYNRVPTPRQPSGTSTSPQPTFNRHANASQSHPRRNRFPITFQPPEADKRTIPRLANTYDSTIHVRAPTVLVLSTFHPSFQPILNLNQIDPRPFPHPSNNPAPTTSQPSFGSNTRTTRFRLNHPTSLIRQLQPILKNNSTSTT